MNVLIADDERIVLEGLKSIIDWTGLGFTICQTAENGQDALDKIMNLKPDLVLMDIRMPRKTGIEVVQDAVEQGYTGKFIILSGISDFKLAQTAMRYGVDFYLTKPIDEKELEQAVTAIHNLILKESRSMNSYEQYRDKAKQRILEEILLGTCDYRTLDPGDLRLDANIYQVISYENYNQEYFCHTWNFADLMRVTNQDNNTFDILEFDQRKVILLKGDFAISKFQNLKRHYHSAPQKGSPFDSIFIVYGQEVSRISDIHHSYQDVCRLMDRRFFCEENQHIVGYEELTSADTPDSHVTKEMAPDYAQRFSMYIQSHNQSLIAETLKELSDSMRAAALPITSIKHLLIDIYILVKQKIMLVPSDTEIPFPANAAAIDLLERKYYLYEIITFLAEQFDMWTNSVGCTSGENVIDEVLYYIRNNYSGNLKLESIAPLFGYNSSYLGKIFSKKMGMNFNAYVDKVRIEEAKLLLLDDRSKVYEIAKQLGYSNVDYFHKKFRKYVGTSPAEYRKSRPL